MDIQRTNPRRGPAVSRRRAGWQKQYFNLRSLAGDIPTLATLRSVLKSLGKFRTGLPVRSLSALCAMPGYAEFTLGKKGQLFLKELLGSADIGPRAFFIVNSKNGRWCDDLGTLRPRGILFDDRTNGRACFLDLGALYPLPENKLDRLSLLDSMKEEEGGLIAQLGERFFGARAAGIKRLGFELETVEGAQGYSNGFRLLNLDSGVYSQKRGSDDPGAFAAGPDFQRVLCRDAQHIKDKTVVETGVGFGANLVHALRLGARRVWGNDIFHVYRQLSRWNVQFAQDTGQLKAVDPESFQIADSAGLDGAPEADVYLFNAPSIRAQGYIDQLRGNPLFSGSFCMSEEDFVGIFAQLKRRLQSSGGLALWRVLPMFSSTDQPSHFALTPGMRRGEHTAQSRAYHPSRILFGGLPGCVSECAQRFLEGQGLHAVPQGEGDVFLINGA